MDDIARHLSISKKTLYEIVDNKEDLIKQVLVMDLEERGRFVEEVHQTSEDAIDALLRISDRVYADLKKLNPAFMYDLEKYYRQLFAMMKEMEWASISTWTERNLRSGIEAGLYRPDLNVDAVSRIYLTIIEGIVLNHERFDLDHYPLAELYLEVIRYHVRGIASPKGIELLSSYINQRKTLIR